MVITWYGQSCFKIQSGEKTLVLDPFSKSVGINPPGFSPDIALITHEHYDHNNIKSLRGDYFLVNGPGEYEVRGVKIWGIESFHDNEGGAKRGLNTLYIIEVEGMRLLHMGDFGQELLTDSQLEEIGAIDVLMIPVGGTFTINAKQAVGIINQIEPKIVIPMHYKIPKLQIKELDGVDVFLKEFGEEDIRPQDKLVLKQKDLPSQEENIKVVVMKI